MKIPSLPPGRIALRLVLSTTALSCTGCAGIQSALDPAGPQAAQIDRLWWLMFWTLTAIYGLVMGVLLAAMRRHRQEQPAPIPPQIVSADAERQTTKVIAVALAVSAVILFVLMIADFVTGRALTSSQASGLARGQSPEALLLRVKGYQWWWDFEYEDPTPSQRVRTSNEIHLPLGQPVQLRMTAQDVIHSFWAPNLHGKTDLLPGQQTTTWWQADRPGKYRGQCAEYCGHQHAHMAFVVVAEPPEQFNTWLANQRRPAPQPVSATQQRGQQVFLTRTCVMCHQIRGTVAGAQTAPDLTHLASRQSLAAGTLANTRENLRGWVMNPQHYKPGNRMPAHQLNEADLNALLDYLESLQ